MIFFILIFMYRQCLSVLNLKKENYKLNESLIWKFIKTAIKNIFPIKVYFLKLYYM